MNKILKKIRTDNDLTQKEIANMLGVSRSCVSNWEKGIRKADIGILKKYNELFGYKVDISEQILKSKVDNSNYLDLSQLNEEGVSEILKFYAEISTNSKYLKNA